MGRREFLTGLLAIGILGFAGGIGDCQAKKGRDDVRNEPAPTGLDDDVDSRGRHGASGSTSSGSGSGGSGGGDDGSGRSDSSGSGRDNSERARWEGRNGAILRNARDVLDRF